MFSNLFNRSSPQEDMKRAKAAYEKVVSLTVDSREARSMRLGMSLLCRAHLDKTFIAGAEKTADWQQISAFAAAKGEPPPEMPPASRFQKVKSGKGEVYVYLPEQYVNQAFSLGGRYQTMQITAEQAVEAMQSIANHISNYELGLDKPFQALAFLRAELSAGSGDDMEELDVDMDESGEAP